MNLFEANIILWIEQNLRCGLLTPVMKAITALGNGGVFWIALSLLLIAFKKTRRAGLCCALALVLDLLAVNIILKPLIARPRPFYVLPEISLLIPTPGEFSFPSGHSASSLCAAWAAFRSMKRKIGVPLLVLAALIALSRLYVGVHYPTDVIGGALLGIALGEIAVRTVGAAAEKIKNRKRA